MLNHPINSHSSDVSNGTGTFFFSNPRDIATCGVGPSVSVSCSIPLPPSFGADPSSFYQWLISELSGSSPIPSTRAFSLSSSFSEFQIESASSPDVLAQLSPTSLSVSMVTFVTSWPSTLQTICAGSDIGSLPVVVIDLGRLSPTQPDGKGSERTDAPPESEDSQSLSNGMTISGGGNASENRQSTTTMSAGGWIGIGLGTIALLAAIALMVWLLISRRRQELSEELPSSMEFVTETDEELGRLCGRMPDGTGLNDLGDGTQFAGGDAAVEAFDESYL
jgi:hypothetical protein